MNLFTILLKELGVKHTTSYSTKLYNEHPYRDTFYGISKMLSDYKIGNAGIRVENKEDIVNYKTPFLAKLGEQFVVVKEIKNGDITFYWKEEFRTHSIELFNKQWKGLLLIAQTDENTIEPEYKKHLQKQYYQKGIIAALILSILFLAFLSIRENNLYLTIYFWIFLVLNTAGSYLAFLLLKKELDISDRYGDKICSLFKKANCNTVLESKAAKLAGIISWSEIGLSYFTANLIITVFIPFLQPYLVLYNLFALPYTLWSIWYQAKVAKSWCPLCLSSISLLWGIFILNLATGYLSWNTSFSILGFIVAGIMYLMVFACITQTILLIKKARKLPVTTQLMNHIKNKDEVLEALLKKNTYYEVSNNDSQIIFGNPEADIQITILTNPHCNPCAKMHQRIKKLQKETEMNISVRYILSSFNDKLKETNKYLISNYLQNPHKIEDIFEEWFKKGKHQREDYYKKHPLNPEKTEEMENELKKHDQWKEKNNLSATPTILINGYLLPSIYAIEDLKFITKLDL